MAGSNFFTPISSTCWIALTGEQSELGASSQRAMLAKCTGTPPTTASVFDHGCLMIQTDTATGTNAVFENTGTFAAPIWSPIAGSQTGGTVYGTVSRATTNTTAVTIFDGVVPFPLTVKGVYMVSANNAPGTVWLYTGAGTIATMLGGSIGAMVGSTTVANASLAKGAALQAVTSVVNNDGLVFVNFTSP